MNSKQVVKKLVKMTTRSESANAPDPVVSETEKSRPPAPSRQSTEEPSDRHNTIYLSFTKHLLLTQLLAVTFQSPLFEHLANSFVESLRT